jgi:carboxypeptidase family protein
MCRRHQPFLVTVRNLFHIVIFSLLAISLWGQDAATGALRGVVLDAQGARVTGADIVAIRMETGIRYYTATDSAGRFLLDLLPPGDYSARAEAEGMSPQVSPMVRVEVGGAAQLTFKLSVAGVRRPLRCRSRRTCWRRIRRQFRRW